MKENILIIGGMGPQASLSLHERIIKHAVTQGARSNEDFPAITHISVPIKDFISKPDQKAGAVKLLRSNLECLWRY